MPARDHADDVFEDEVGVPDLVLLPRIGEEDIAANLRLRAERGLIYSYIGNVLLAVNPYKQLPRLMANPMKYCGRYRIELPPHIYAVAEDAFRTMLNEEESQCIIISGESGAGKTESAKLILGYLSSVATQGRGVERVKEVVLKSNPLLEAFGNAKTLRNNNSSRFGKYVEVRFDRFGRPRGGHIRNYLLEKSRIPKPGRGERNFHIFYQLLRGCPPAAAEALRLPLRADPERFGYLATGASILEGVDDAADFAETLSAMKSVGLGGRGQEAIIKLLAAILHLGNAQFTEHASRQGAKIEGEGARLAAELLELSWETLEKSVTTRKIETRGETIVVFLNAVQAAAARDAFAKALYSRLFDFIVATINEALRVVDEEEADDSELLGINVLDIYGFEVFERGNGFEQFLINYVNEKLQQIFIELTLKSEQEDYAREGVAWTPIPFFNNKIVCDLIEGTKPPGVFLIVDDVGATIHAQSEGTGGELVRKLQGVHAGHPHLACTSRGFTIRHYAGSVEYEGDSFVEANRDTLLPEILALAKSSRSKLVLHLFADDEDGPTTGRKQASLGSKMKSQTNQLVIDLMKCNPHYVRCIKPNDRKLPGNFDIPRMVHQIKYLGLRENINVRRAGFAYRQEFYRFNDRYRLLVPGKVTRSLQTDQSICKAMIQHIIQSGQVPDLKTEAQVGRTKLFIRKPETVFRLEEMIQGRRNTAALDIQRAWKRFLLSRHYIKLRRQASNFVTKHKERRRESLHRPFAGDYLFVFKHNPIRRLLAANGEADPPSVAFADSIKVLPKDLAKADRESRLLIITQRNIFLVEHVVQVDVGRRGPSDGPTEYYAVRRKIPLEFLAGVSLSTKADNFLILHVSEWRNNQEQHAEWLEDKAATSCMRCSTKFGLFTRRHHCRHCGKIFCAACCPEKVHPLPDRGLYEPTRMCWDCIGLGSSDPWQDWILENFRKTEIMATLVNLVKSNLNKNLSVTFSDGVSLFVAHVAENKVQKVGKTIEFKTEAHAHADEQASKVSLRDASKLTVSTGKGLSSDYVMSARKRDELRQQERERQRQLELVRKAALQQQREQEREEERKRRIAERKAKKAADAEEARRKAEAAASAKAGSASGSARGGAAGFRPPAPASGLAVKACSSCGCSDFRPHTFKKNSCAGCFHAH